MKLEKMTKEEKVAEKRWYEDACGTALALEFLGERWSMLIVRELMLGPRRFGELKADMMGISANVLTQRLESLERANILVRRKLPPPANVQVYELTQWGYESEPIFQAMGRWATRSPLHDPTLPLSPVSAMLSLRTMINPDRPDLRMTIGFRFPGVSFIGRLDAKELVIERGETDAADVVFVARHIREGRRALSLCAPPMSCSRPLRRASSPSSMASGRSRSRRPRAGCA